MCFVGDAIGSPTWTAVSYGEPWTLRWRGVGCDRAPDKAASFGKKQRPYTGTTVFVPLVAQVYD